MKGKSGEDILRLTVFFFFAVGIALVLTICPATALEIDVKKTKLPIEWHDDLTSWLVPKGLQKYTSAKGWRNNCPPRSADEKQGQASLDLGTSPEVQARLEADFPPRTSDKNLRDMLLKRHFAITNSKCDRSVVYMARRKYIHRGFSWDSLVEAGIYWQLDSRQKIKWIKGFISEEPIK